MSNPVPAGTSLRRMLIRRYRSHVIVAAAFSAIINLLYLTPSIFMLQIYDRVVPTGGTMTLALLTVVGMGLLGLLATLDWVRGRVLLKAAAQVDADLAEPLLTAILSRRSLTRTERATAVRELDALRSVVSGSAITAFLDAPWIPIYILAATLLNPWLGLFTFAASLVILALAWSNERATHGLYAHASIAAGAASTRQSHVTAYATEVRALGMVDTLRRSIIQSREGSNEASSRAGFTAAAHSGWARFVRLAAQSLALVVAAWLAIHGDLSAGAISVATLMLGRALAPIELLVGSWKGIVRGQTALAQLETILSTADHRSYTQLSEPTGRIAAEHLSVTAPNSDRVTVSDVSFALDAGDSLAMIGLSGAGKSTLLRALVGAADASKGAVRLDGAALVDWDPMSFGRHIGYLPQDRVIFAGTVKDNIARFDTVGATDTAAIDAAVIEAATRAGAHEMILRLPAGYDTQLGHDGTGLSAGQAQRIALARACYGRPKLMVLDEPCANLDTEGKAALFTLIDGNRRDGVTTIFSTHDRGLLAAANKVMLLTDGRVAHLGATENGKPVGPVADVIPTKAQPSAKRN